MRRMPHFPRLHAHKLQRLIGDIAHGDQLLEIPNRQNLTQEFDAVYDFRQPRTAVADRLARLMRMKGKAVPNQGSAPKSDSVFQTIVADCSP